MAMLFCLLDYVKADGPCFTYTMSSVCFVNFPFLGFPSFPYLQP